MKTAYVLFKKNELVGCYFARSRAARLVDEHLGSGLFAPGWEGDKKGDYEIVKCEVAYDKIYIVPIKGKRPRIYPSLDALTDYLKSHDIKIKKKNTRPTSFRVETSRGEVRGKVINVK